MSGSPGTCTIHACRLPAAAAPTADLTEQERARAARIATPGARVRFVAGALLLRSVAGGLLGLRAHAVPVERTCDRCGRPHGRPRVPGSGLHFSVSHSGELVLVAVSADGPTGVDVEEVAGHRCAGDPRLTEVACAPDERVHIDGARAFLTCWTRKEAVLKATGEGLRVRPSAVVVTAPASTPRLLRLQDSPAPPCAMADLDLGPGYLASAAVLTFRPVRFAVVEATIH